MKNYRLPDNDTIPDQPDHDSTDDGDTEHPGGPS